MEFEVFNAGGDENNFTKRGIVELISKKISNPVVKYRKEGSDPRNYRVNFKKVKETLDFVPQYSISDGIDELLSAIENRVFDIDGTISHGNYNIKIKN